jgi:hypothetical protein
MVSDNAPTCSISAMFALAPACASIWTGVIGSNASSALATALQRLRATSALSCLGSTSALRQNRL